MTAAFYISGAVAIIATVMAITRINIVHALLYFIVSLIATGVIFFLLGAPFASALTVIINAGAIIVLFIFIVMTLNIGPQAYQQERKLLPPWIWIGPAVLTIILIIELFYALSLYRHNIISSEIVSPKEVGIALFGPYMAGVELASVLLLVGLLGAYHLGKSEKEKGVND